MPNPRVVVFCNFFIERLQLTGNAIDGVIPVELSFLTNLLVLGLGRNNLVGEIPSELGNMHHLGKRYVCVAAI